MTIIEILMMMMMYVAWYVILKIIRTNSAAGLSIKKNCHKYAIGLQRQT